MKKVTLILGLFILSVAAFAQEKTEVKRSDLKGPAYKNFQSWMHPSVPTKVYSDSKVKTLQGPAYKNRRPGKNTSKAEQTLVTTVGSERQKLKGPAYKNYNHHIRKPN